VAARANVTAMTDWVPLLLTGLGAGVTGSVITTYGSQARERRDARKEALARLADADHAIGEASNDRRSALDAGRAVGTAALLAAVPMHVVDTYLLAYDVARDDRLKWAPPRISPHDPASVGIHVYREATELLTKVLWHPMLTLPVRRYRSRRIRRFITGILPPGTTIYLRRTRSARKWERAALQAAKTRGDLSGTSTGG
jgi:hypothetical protein